jgi:hypothetical protein
MRRIMRRREEAGLTRVEILGSIGRRREGVVMVDKYASVRIY